MAKETIPAEIQGPLLRYLEAKRQAEQLGKQIDDLTNQVRALQPGYQQAIAEREGAKDALNKAMDRVTS